LNFLQANWTPLRDLKASDPTKYASLIGAGGRSLREMRNRIAHEGHCFSESGYVALAGVAERSTWEDWITRDRAEIARLSDEIATAEAQIDSIIYDLFDLTTDEIALLESAVRQAVCGKRR